MTTLTKVLSVTYISITNSPFLLYDLMRKSFAFVFRITWFLRTSLQIYETSNKTVKTITVGRFVQIIMENQLNYSVELCDLISSRNNFKPFFFLYSVLFLITISWVFFKMNRKNCTTNKTLLIVRKLACSFACVLMQH